MYIWPYSQTYIIIRFIILYLQQYLKKDIHKISNQFFVKTSQLLTYYYFSCQQNLSTSLAYLIFSNSMCNLASSESSDYNYNCLQIFVQSVFSPNHCEPTRYRNYYDYNRTVSSAFAPWPFSETNCQLLCRQMGLAYY